MITSRPLYGVGWPLLHLLILCFFFLSNCWLWRPIRMRGPEDGGTNNGLGDGVPSLFPLFLLMCPIGPVGLLPPSRRRGLASMRPGLHCSTEQYHASIVFVSYSKGFVLQCRWSWPLLRRITYIQTTSCSVNKAEQLVR